MSGDELESLYQIAIPYSLRGLLIHLMNDLYDSGNYMSELNSLIAQIALLVNSFKEVSQYFERYLMQLSSPAFIAILTRIQMAITNAYEENSQETTETIWEAIQVIDYFYKANQKREDGEQISYKEFYNEALNRDINLEEQYIEWLEQKKQMNDPNESYVNINNIINYQWILDCQSKSDILLIDSREKQKDEIDKQLINTVLQNPFGAQNMDQYFAYLVLEINRETIIEDTLNSLVREDINFRKPLRIKFVGELGVDEGGVQKEFFQLVIRKLFDPLYTMFTYNEDSRMFWFNGNSFEDNMKFELIGILMGIAIYNQNILDLHLPIACYKKLLDIQPTLKDLQELMPQVAQSLDYILKCEDENLETTLYQTFTVELDRFGDSQVHDLVPDGAETYVNQENKAEYVYLFIDFIFNQSCEDQFRSFKRGFFKVVSEDVI